MGKPKILFVFDHEYEDIWKDGLYMALELLRDDFEITKLNLHNKQLPDAYSFNADFVLGWGGINSPVDVFLTYECHRKKKGLCIAGNAFKPTDLSVYDVLFYETEWVRDYLDLDFHHRNLVHAFGVNTDIFHSLNEVFTEKGHSVILSEVPKIWDYITVGAFAKWKRQEKILEKKGTKLAVGQIQKNNLSESIDIIGNLLLGDCMVSDMVEPEVLAKMYNASNLAYAPMDVFGGGERFVWEAKAVGVPVVCEEDNPKLKELIDSEVKDAKWYSERLKEGILSCL